MTTAISRAPAADRRRIWMDLLLYPGHTLPTAAAPVVVAVGLAFHHNVFAAGPVLAAFLASWFIHVGGVFTDNLVLITKHRNVREHPELLDALDDGSLGIGRLSSATALWFIAAALLAPYLASVVGWQPVIVLGVLGSLAAVGYSAGPLPYTRFGAADPVFFAMFAFVAVPAAYGVQAAAHASLSAPGFSDLWRLVSADAFLVGVPVGALVTNVLLIDEIRDVDFDRVKGWRTGSVRNGRRFGRAEIAVLTAVAYIIPPLLWLVRGYGLAVLLPLITLPSAVGMARAAAHADRFEELFPLTPRAASLGFAFSLLLAIGLALG